MDRVRIIDVKEDILATNEAMAAELRARLKENFFSLSISWLRRVLEKPPFS